MANRNNRRNPENMDLEDDDDLLNEGDNQVGEVGNRGANPGNNILEGNRDRANNVIGNAANVRPAGQAVGDARAVGANAEPNVREGDGVDIWHEGQLGRGCYAVAGQRRRTWDRRRFERSHFNAMTRVVDMLYQMANPYRGGQRRRRSGSEGGKEKQ